MFIDQCMRFFGLPKTPTLEVHCYWFAALAGTELITIIVPGKWNNLKRRGDLFHSIFSDVLQAGAEQQIGFQHFQRFFGERTVHLKFLAVRR